MKVSIISVGGKTKYLVDYQVMLKRKEDNITGLVGDAVNVDMQKSKIGSSLTSSGSSLRGLTFEEEILLLPNIIGKAPSSQEWNKATDDYWANISVSVPARTGVELNCSIIFDEEVGAKTYFETLTEIFSFSSDVDNHASDEDFRVKMQSITLPEKSTPQIISDYIMWRYCLVYGRVANRKKDIFKSKKISFFMESKDEIVIQRASSLKRRNAATKAYLSIHEDVDKRDLVLRSFGENILLLPEDERDIMLEKYSIDESEKFIEIATDENLSFRSIIRSGLIHGKIGIIPNTENYTYDDNVIGNGLSQAIAYFKSPDNSPALSRLNAQLEHLGYKKAVEKTKTKPASVVTNS